MEAKTLTDIIVGCIILAFGGILSIFGYLILRMVTGFDTRFDNGEKRMDKTDGKLEEILTNLNSDKLVRASTYTFQVAELKQADHELQKQFNEHVSTCPAEHMLKDGGHA